MRAYDPASANGAADLVPGLEVGGDPYEACNGAASLAVLTEWDEFRWMDFDRVAEMIADSDRAGHPEHARPGGVASAGLHLRRRRARPAVGPPTARRRHRCRRVPRLAPVRARSSSAAASRRPRQPPHRPDGEPRGPARPPGVHVLAPRRHRLRPRRRARSTRCCTSPARRARSTTSSTRSRP